MKQRGAEFAGVGNQFIVDGDLLANLVEVGDPFGAQHFLDLKDHRVAVFKHQGNILAHRNPAEFFLFDDFAAELFAHLFVGGKSQDIVEDNFFHDSYRERRLA